MLRPLIKVGPYLQTLHHQPHARSGYKQQVVELTAGAELDRIDLLAWQIPFPIITTELILVVNWPMCFP